MNITVWQCDKCGYMQNMDTVECKTTDIFCLKQTEYDVIYNLYICKWCLFSAFKYCAQPEVLTPVYVENKNFYHLKFRRKR